MIALDTNLLVHAYRRDADLYLVARALLQELAEGTERWAIPFHCIVEFYGIVTHSSIWRTPAPASHAFAQVRAWLGSPSLIVLYDEEGTLEVLAQLAVAAKVAGPRIHDARIAATCLSHDVRELWTIDRDFSRYPSLRTRNPLL